MAQIDLSLHERVGSNFRRFRFTRRQQIGDRIAVPDVASRLLDLVDEHEKVHDREACERCDDD